MTVSSAEKSSNESEQQVGERDVTPPRRAYQAPKLRHLGSVRELTLGSTAGMPEGGGTFMPVM